MGELLVWKARGCTEGTTDLFPLLVCRGRRNQLDSGVGWGKIPAPPSSLTSLGSLPSSTCQFGSTRSQGLASPCLYPRGDGGSAATILDLKVDMRPYYGEKLPGICSRGQEGTVGHLALRSVLGLPGEGRCCPEGSLEAHAQGSTSAQCCPNESAPTFNCHLHFHCPPQLRSLRPAVPR